MSTITPSRQTCCRCMEVTDHYLTVHYGDRRFHFCSKPDCQAQYRDEREEQIRRRKAVPQGDPVPNRCAVCGGLNPGDITHTRCM